MPEYVNLLDKITESRELPEGWDAWAIRTARPDLTSQHGYRYPFPGGVAEAPGPILAHGGACPGRVGDGICAALTWSGMASGGVPARTLLLVAYRESDVLGREPDKLRLRRMLVADLIDGERLVRESGKGAYLRGANLQGADLYGANLQGAHLYGAYLYGANLQGANLQAYLYGASLHGAYLRGADLQGANLRGADLYGADLQGANLRGANLFGANLYGANLRGADVYGAYLQGANLQGQRP